MRCHFSLYCLDLAAWDAEPVVCHVAETVLCTPACIYYHFSLYLTGWDVEPFVTRQTSWLETGLCKQLVGLG